VFKPELIQRVQGFLEPEIAQGLVEVFEDANTITVRLRGKGMFPSAKARVKDKFVPILMRVGEALEAEKGMVIVAGHSDNVPIRSVRFPSNWHLSLARAESVLKLLAQSLSDPRRLSAEGRAANEPIASNDTREGQEQNRRIEVILMKAG
jgi:type VI secretion system protein ImpK